MDEIKRNITVSKLYSRNEIIVIWKNQNADMLELPCCPSCRDILYNNYGKLQCLNEDCAVGDIIFTGGSHE